MRYRIGLLLVLLSTNCHSQERVRPSTNDRYSEFNPQSQLMRSLSEPTTHPSYSVPSGPGKISVQDMRLPPKAARELQRSQKAFQSGDWQASASHLEKVLAIDPDYWPARNTLGKLYIGLHEFDRAVQEFEQAFAIAPHSAEPLKNLSATLLLLQRYPEAERVARATLELDPAQTETHYILGCALVAQERFTPETEQQLRLGTSSIPSARLLLANLLSRRGEREQAAAELRAYLEVPGAPEKEQVQSSLARLTRKIEDPNNGDDSTPD